ncbi:hypothetical protein O6H91_21G002900 [Diphasiastrum complanatum]|uniref:Uncharacterized protein n=1 Tax=Diphasiastrum complanatum TaxID=34168 RepID=A0ACC2AIY0_DIPCM|nr:hypothetical protein O6H91_21G002900 [Diphasiastrum complanatum]
MQDLEKIHYILGLEIDFLKDKAFICQSKYALSMLKKFNMLNCKSIETPMEQNVKDSNKGDERSFKDITLFRSLIGSLIWLTITRPDISFSVHKLSQAIQNPSIYHWKKAKRVLRYVSSTFDFGLLYKSEDLSIIGYSDSDFVGDRADRKSTSAYVIYLGGNLISWLSKKQDTVSLSSCEAEYKVLTTTTKEVLWIKRLLVELKIIMEENIHMIMCDNISAQALANNPIFHARSKHIEVAHHFVREKLIGGEIKLEHIDTSSCIADMLTKPLSKSSFNKHRANLGVIPRSMFKSI